MGAPRLESDTRDSDDSGMQRTLIPFERLAGMIDCVLLAVCNLAPEAGVKESCAAVTWGSASAT
jgi:hypothetical protein